MTPTDPKQALLTRAASVLERTAATVLWKYVDEDGKDFFLAEKRTTTVRSPFTGKAFVPKPERFSLSAVGQDLKEEEAKSKTALWKYTDDEGGVFYLSTRVMTALRSPTSGKTFTPKPEKTSLVDIGKSLREEARTAATVLWKYVDELGNDFYLTVKQTYTLHSPYNGKPFQPAPERSNLSDVGQALQEEGAKSKSSLWKYTTDDGEVFYLDERVMTALRSPFSGKTFTPKPEKATLMEIGKSLREEPKVADTALTAALRDTDKKVVDAFSEKKAAEGRLLVSDGKTLEKMGMGGGKFAWWEGNKIHVAPEVPTVKSDEVILRYMKSSIPANDLAPNSWFNKSAAEVQKLASEILDQKGTHPALQVILAQSGKVVASLMEASSRTSKGQDASLLLAQVKPEIEKLGRIALTVARQLEERLG